MKTTSLKRWPSLAIAATLALPLTACQNAADSIELDAGATADATVAADLIASPDAHPDSTGRWLVASEGGSMGVVSTLQLPDGSLGLLVNVRGSAKLGTLQLVAPSATHQHAYFIVVDAGGRMLSQQRVLIVDSDSYLPDVSLTRHGSTVFILGSDRYATTVDPDGRKLSVSKAIDTDVGIGSWLARAKLVRAQSGGWTLTFDPLLLRNAGTPLDVTPTGWIVATAFRGQQHTLIVNGQAMTISAARPPGQSDGAHATLIAFDHNDNITRSWIVEGAADSAIGRIRRVGDDLIVCGTLFGFGRLPAIFDYGKSTERTLVTQSSDDDPAADIFLARLNSKLELKWLKMIKAYAIDHACEMEVHDSQIVTSVRADGYDLVASFGATDQTAYKESGLISYDLDGKHLDHQPLPQDTALHLLREGSELFVVGKLTGRPITLQLRAGAAQIPDPTVVPRFTPNESARLANQVKYPLAFAIGVDKSLALHSVRWGAWISRNALDDPALLQLFGGPHSVWLVGTNPSDSNPLKVTIESGDADAQTVAVPAGDLAWRTGRSRTPARNRTTREPTAHRPDTHPDGAVTADAPCGRPSQQSYGPWVAGTGVALSSAMHTKPALLLLATLLSQGCADPPYALHIGGNKTDLVDLKATLSAKSPSEIVLAFSARQRDNPKVMDDEIVHHFVLSFDPQRLAQDPTVEIRGTAQFATGSRSIDVGSSTFQPSASSDIRFAGGWQSCFCGYDAAATQTIVGTLHVDSWDGKRLAGLLNATLSGDYPPLVGYDALVELHYPFSVSSGF